MVLGFALLFSDFIRVLVLRVDGWGRRIAFVEFRVEPKRVLDGFLESLAGNVEMNWTSVSIACSEREIFVLECGGVGDDLSLFCCVATRVVDVSVAADLPCGDRDVSSNAHSAWLGLDDDGFALVREICVVDCCSSDGLTGENFCTVTNGGE